MAQAVAMPKLGLTMTEGTIVKWLKREGDQVVAGDAIFEVETDKLTNKVETAIEGTLLKIIVQEGCTVECFAIVAYIGEQGEALPDATTPASAKNDTVKSLPHEPAETSRPIAQSSGGRVLASPAARKLAKDKEIDISLVTPSESGKQISLHDVESYITKPLIKASGMAKKLAIEAGISLQTIPVNGRIMATDVDAQVILEEQKALEEKVCMSGMRKTIAKRMRESQDISPTVAMDINVNMTAMKTLKNDLAAEGVKVSYTDLLVKMLAGLLMEFPSLNCSIEGDQVTFKHYVNIGVAVALTEGLMVPVVKNAHKKKVKDISIEIKGFAEEARNGTIQLEKITGGTFTITNLGMFGIESFTPIINQPEVAILGVNTIMDTAVVENGTVMIHPMMRLSLVMDHRIIDGAVGAQFLSKLKKIIEKPTLLFV